MHDFIGQRVGFELVKKMFTGSPKFGEAFVAENISFGSSIEDCLDIVLLQSGFCLNTTLSYVIGPFAFVHTTQVVSLQPSPNVWSPEIVNGVVDLIDLLLDAKAHPAILITHEVTGHKVDFVFVNRRATAPPKSGAALVAENSISGIVGDGFFARVLVQSGFWINSMLSNYVSPPAFVQVTQFVSFQPLGSVWSPVIFHGVSAVIDVFVAVPVHPVPIKVQALTGQVAQDGSLHGGGGATLA